MTEVDVIARAIDWLDACKSNNWLSVSDLYSDTARVAIPGALLRGPTTVLHGISEITAYWRDTFGKAPRADFELVELYPGHDSAVLIYYDEQCQRVSEFLQFAADGLITQSVRHLIPRRRQVYATDALPDLQDETQKRAAILQCEARQSLGEARRLLSALPATLAATRGGAACLAQRGIAALG